MLNKIIGLKRWPRQYTPPLSYQLIAAYFQLQLYKFIINSLHSKLAKGRFIGDSIAAKFEDCTTIHC